MISADVDYGTGVLLSNEEATPLDVLDRAVGAMLMGEVHGVDRRDRAKHVLAVVLVSTLVEPINGSDPIEMVQESTQRMSKALRIADPVTAPRLNRIKFKLSHARSEWVDYARLAYSNLLIDGEPKPVASEDLILRAVEEGRIDFALTNNKCV